VEKSLSDVVASGFIGGIIVLFFKVLYDHYVSGRADKGVYMLLTECEKRRVDCGLPFVKKELQSYAVQCGEYKSMTDERLKEHDKQLDLGRGNFDKVMEDLSEIRQIIAGMPTYEDSEKMKKDITSIMVSVSRIQMAVEMLLDKKDKLNG
jgi:hypothetical protein